jgi:hypothetical protein
MKFNISPEGRRFELAFHLRYSAVRDSTTPPNHDQRRFSTWDEPLRGYQDVSFLSLGGRHSKYRYQAQISYAVIGTDNSTWDAYLFDDTYFDSKQDGKRLASVYYEDAFDPSILDPRQKLLSVLRDSLKRIKCEWSMILDRLRDSSRHHAQTGHDLETLTKTGRPRQQMHAIEQITRAEVLSNALLRELSNILDTTDGLFDRYQILFGTDVCAPLISQITDIAKELVNLRTTLKSVVKINKRIIDNKRLWLRHESSEAERKHHLIAKFIYAMAIAAGIFSFNEVLPFKQNAATFLCVVLIVRVLIHFGYDPLYCWQVALTLASRVTFHDYFQSRSFTLMKPLSSKPTDRFVGWQDLKGLLGLAGALFRLYSLFDQSLTGKSSKGRGNPCWTEQQNSICVRLTRRPTKALCTKESAFFSYVLHGPIRGLLRKSSSDTSGTATRWSTC